jgi:hypothetical protein
LRADIEIMQAPLSSPPVSESDLLPLPAEFAALSMAEVSDALNHLGLPGSALGIAAIGSDPRIRPRVYRALYESIDTL